MVIIKTDNCDNLDVKKDIVIITVNVAYTPETKTFVDSEVVDVKV